MAASACVVFFHAHPDDEAIFTGGTLLRLAEHGHRTVVVFATNGDADPTGALAATRMAEAREACELLGVSRVEFLGHGDSGLTAHDASPQSFWRADAGAVVQSLRELFEAVAADAVVLYDTGGIYGHPDHIAVHRHGTAAAAAAGVATVYESTVDREYLHFVETHLVGHAVQSLLGMEIAATNTAPLGVPTVEVSCTVDVRHCIDAKRAAMAAHRSQIPPESETLTMDVPTFEGVYGFEWYVRASGPRHVLDDLGF